MVVFKCSGLGTDAAKTTVELLSWSWSGPGGGGTSGLIVWLALPQDAILNFKVRAARSSLETSCRLCRHWGGSGLPEDGGCPGSW